MKATDDFVLVFSQRWPITAWAKPLDRPCPGSAAFLFINRASTGWPLAAEFTLHALFTSNKFPTVGHQPEVSSEYHVTDLFDKRYVGRFTPLTTIRLTVNPSGVTLIRAVPVEGTTDDITPVNPCV